MSGSEDEDMALDAGGDATLGGKRRRKADDEQSILKWMRHVPGPLQDVMKKRGPADSSQETTLGSPAPTRIGTRWQSRQCSTKARGWRCASIWAPAISGTLYGSIKIRSLKCTVQSIVDDDEALAKVPQLLVLIKSVRYVDEEIVAVLHDPTEKWRATSIANLLNNLDQLSSLG
ncbi:uncharacterized protein IUM83_07037 [Phytophthora cinnamomi]|nr:hypothetical protein IUM83_07037 [Phytophthora cinnamomi]